MSDIDENKENLKSNKEENTEEIKEVPFSKEAEVPVKNTCADGQSKQETKRTEKEQSKETVSNEAPIKQSNFKKKLNRLWKDDRKYIKRLLFSLLVLFAACFTFIFFGPMEITAYSQASITFSMMQALPIMALFTIIVCVAAALIISAFRGRIYNYLITAVFSSLLCGYLQGNFFNGSMGALTGDAIKWQLQKTNMISNFLIWLLIFLIPFIILYFNKDVWKKVIIFASAALIVMQSVAFVTIFTSGKANISSNKNNYLTKADEADFSSKKNTLIFLLDRLDYDHIEEVKKSDPNFFNKLDGFTSYNNAISEHARTKPAINYLFTNCDLVWKVPEEEYFEKSWNYNKKNILSDVKSQGYKIDFYTEIDAIFGNGSTVKDYVSNLSANNSNIRKKVLMKNLCFLSAYRYMPTVAKPFFWCYTDDVNKDVFTVKDKYEIDETQFGSINNYTLNNKTNYLKYYHFMGSHPPYTVNENGQKSDKASCLTQTKGNFNILYRTFDKMKKNGTYKNATILILGDHGDAVSDTLPLQKANRIGFFYKPAGCADTPLKESHAPISFKNVPASIAKSTGMSNYKKYGTPIEEVGENDKVTRYFYKAVMGDNYEKSLYIYKIDGDAKDFNNWKNIKIEHPKKDASFWS